MKIGLAKLSGGVVALFLTPTAVLAASVITKTELYNQVWWSSFWIWLFVSMVGTVIASLIAGAFSRGCAVGILIAGLVVVTLCGGLINAGAMGRAASGPDWDAMVLEKATFVEKLLGVWVGRDRTIHECRLYNDTDTDVGALAATGCANVTRDSYCADWDDEEDECDDTDYRWYAWFTHEVSSSGELNVYEDGHVDFAQHCALQDWQNYTTNQFPGGRNFCVEFYDEWLRIDTALARRELLSGVVYHNTLNWVNADTNTVFRGSTQLVEGYQKANLMPSNLPITNSVGEVYTKDIFGGTNGRLGYDYQIIQFLGQGDRPSATVQEELQQRALLWAADAGPKLKAQLMLNLAPASEVPYPDQWISATKAHLMDNSVWAATPFKTTMAMNMAIWNCGVSDDWVSVLWCRMETGAFEDNVELKVFVSTLEPFPLTPNGLFGMMTGGFVTDSAGSITVENPDWDDRDVPIAKVEIAFDGGEINRAMYGISSGHKFVKVSKDTYANRQFLIRPDEEQISRIKSAKASQTFLTIGGFWVLVIVLLGYTAAKNR